jgi:hypothetical protein
MSKTPINKKNPGILPGLYIGRISEFGWLNGNWIFIYRDAVPASVFIPSKLITFLTGAFATA